MLYQITIIASIAAFMTVFFFMPRYIKFALNRKVFGNDMYKVEKNKVAESGGILVLVGILIALFVQLYFYTEFSKELLAVIAACLIVALIGLADDFYNAPWKIKALMPLLAAPPLIAIKAGVTSMYLPFVGYVDFGAAYTFALIPLALTGASNAINMIAGFNGLEAGTGIIISAALATIGYITGREIIVLLSLPLLFALAAFYIYNKYPAKVFPGDVGTYLIGVVIASIVIIGNIEFAGIILVGPHIINFFMYFYGYFKRGREITRKERFGAVAENGYLRAPHPYYLPFFIIRLSDKMTEKKATYILLSIQTIFAILAVYSVYASLNLTMIFS